MNNFLHLKQAVTDNNGSPVSLRVVHTFPGGVNHNSTTDVNIYYISSKNTPIINPQEPANNLLCGGEMEASVSRPSFELTELEAADHFNLSHIDSEIDVNYDNKLGENVDTGNTNNMDQFWSNAHKPLVSFPCEPDTEPSTSCAIYESKTVGSTKLNLRQIPDRNIVYASNEYIDFSREDSDGYWPSKSSSSSSSFSERPQSVSVYSSNINYESPHKKGKKRARAPEKWKTNFAKLLNNFGKSYTSRSGKTIKEKIMRPPCPKKCKLSCVTKFSDLLRAAMFKNYWQSSS
uniref:(California timema) hypothetical protein n=1 Tax=Timema californicum TaxID=61474 RepID=A0A7R9P6C9_TIMCA|nr:unnamed protein product [Timema californicum]